ncbi:pimeloyl-ACP methyl ester carboxylesterase [Pseudonocardia parietis]|uniref:prolyl aminopeptidase n=1 Tax=Pseudonocardia parietis TaxID=570936 RepID=A0ABS4VNU6_9PSEU|nr:pimeloyl-ACP methyl ester carboxylesterase [Pseudonocardia parietis]
MPLYPPIEPYDSGTINTDDGQSIYWEACGNPDGRPALYLHGGPGTGSSIGARRYFDPDRFRAVLFDQRGCGRSLPSALRDAPRLDGIPGALIHGRHDISGPVDVAWHLHQRWSTSDLHVIDDAGHGGSQSFTDAVVDSLSRIGTVAQADRTRFSTPKRCRRRGGVRSAERGESDTPRGRPLTGTVRLAYVFRTES